MALPQAKRGRPTVYTSEFADHIVTELAEGRSLRDTCLEMGISASSVRGWVVDNIEGFAERYVRARRLQADSWADEILADAEDSSKDTVKRVGRDGSEYEAPDHEWIARSRLIVDTKKWLMAKLHPLAYSEKMEVKNTHEAGDSLLALLEKISTHGNGSESS